MRCFSIKNKVNPEMLEKLELIYNNYRNLEEQLSDPSVSSDLDRFMRINKEYKKMQPVVEAYHLYSDVVGNIDTARRMIEEETDADMRDMARMELGDLLPEKNRLEEEIRVLLIPRDPEDDKDALLEIRSGTGGDEASIFAGDLMRMYSRYMDGKGWKYELIEESQGTAGGYSKIILEVHGEDVYGTMKYESGVHRVQRVPETESKGRVHTSAASVVVMPILEMEDVKINKADLKIDVYRATGSGGQHVNTTDSAVRITHLPTNTVVECQEGRSQIKNREIAMTKLFNKIYDNQKAELDADIANRRRSLVSSGDRSAKIRTYNFPQNRLTDHRINLTLYNLGEIMEGEIGNVIDELKIAETTDKMQEMEEI